MEKIGKGMKGVHRGKFKTFGISNHMPLSYSMDWQGSMSRAERPKLQQTHLAGQGDK